MNAPDAFGDAALARHRSRSTANSSAAADIWANDASAETMFILMPEERHISSADGELAARLL
jgi:hypothetical protein